MNSYVDLDAVPIESHNLWSKAHGRTPSLDLLEKTAFVALHLMKLQSN